MAFVKQTLERLDELDVHADGCGGGWPCPCCRRVLDTHTIVAPLRSSYLRHYVDGIGQFFDEMRRMDDTLDWLRTNPTWIAATREHVGMQAELDQFDAMVDALQRSIADELKHLNAIHPVQPLPGDNDACAREATLDGRPATATATGTTEPPPCRFRLRIAELQAECTAVRFLRKRVRSDLGRSMCHTPHRFARYCHVDAAPVSELLQTLTGTLRTTTHVAYDAHAVARLDKYGAPVTFATFLPQRIGHLLGVTRRTDFLMTVVRHCRRRNMLRDLVEGLQRACRKSSHTGVRRWLLGVVRSPCEDDARFQTDFLRCVEDVVRDRRPHRQHAVCTLDGI